MSTTTEQRAHRQRRWRLALGGGTDGENGLSDADRALDAALALLYDADAERGAGLGASAPRVARWLGDIRERFPTAVVRVMQQDAFERLQLRSMLVQPELLDAIEPDIHLVASLVALGSLIPEASKASARLVVRKLVDDSI